MHISNLLISSCSILVDTLWFLVMIYNSIVCKKWYIYSISKFSQDAIDCHQEVKGVIVADFYPSGKIPSSQILLYRSSRNYNVFSGTFFIICMVSLPGAVFFYFVMVAFSSLPVNGSFNGWSSVFFSPYIFLGYFLFGDLLIFLLRDLQRFRQFCYIR